MSNFSANSDWFQNYVTASEVEAFNKNKPKLTYKQFEKENTLATQIENQSFFNKIEAITPLIPEYDYTDRLQDQKENLLGLFRINFAEIEERDAKREQRRKELASLVTDEDKEGYDTTQTNIINELKEATKNNIPLWQVVNPDNFITKEMGEAQFRLYDTTNGYSMSQYTTMTTADTYKSWFGNTRRVRMGGAQRLQLDTPIADLFRKISTAAKIDFDFEGPIAEANGLTIKEYIDNHVNENPDQYWFWQNIKDVFIDTGVDGRLGPWNKTMLSTKLLSIEDEGWTMEGGDRDKLIEILSMDDSEIGLMGTIHGDIRQFIAENPDVLENLKSSQNGWQFIAALNARKSERVIGNYLTENNNSYGSAGFMNLLGYGFTTDPALALDIAATVGLTAVTAGGYTVARGAAGLFQVGSKIKFGLSIADKAKKIRNFDKMVDLAKNTNVVGRYENASKLAKGLQFTSDVVQFGRRLLPTQIVSELAFPSLKFLRHSRTMKVGDDAAEAGTSWWKYLKNENYLGDSTKHRMLHRAIGGALEGTVWGTMEYWVMEDYQNRVNSLMFGNEAANALALDRYRSGAFGHMLMFGVAFGGIGGPLIGEAFTQLGRVPKGLIEGGQNLSRWADQIMSVGGQDELGYKNKPWPTRFTAKTINAAGNAITWLGGGNQYSLEQQFLMYKILSLLSPEEIARIKADESGKAMTKTLVDLQDRVSQWHWASAEGGLDLMGGFDRTSDKFDNLDAADRTTSTFIRMLEDDMEAQEHNFRMQGGFRDHVRRAQMQEFNQRLATTNDADLMAEAMKKADPNKPPTDAEGTALNEELETIAEQKSKAATKKAAAEAEQARRKAGEDPEEPVETVQDVQTRQNEEMELRDEEVVAKKQQRNEEIKTEQKKIRTEKPKGKHTNKWLKSREDWVALETEKNQNIEFIKAAEESKKKAESDEEIKARHKQELEDAANELQNLTDEDLGDRISDLEMALGELQHELDTEALAYWLQNPEKFVEMIGWFRKTVLNERMRGDTPNANNLPPMLTAIEKLEDGRFTRMIELFAPGVYFSRAELERIIPHIKKKNDREFLTAALNRSTDSDWDMQKGDAKKLAEEIEEILIDQSITKDYTLEEMQFINRVINNPDEETVLKAFRETRIDTYVNAIMIDAAKKNKVITADDLVLYNQDPELVAEVFAKAQAKIGKMAEEFRKDNYASILKTQGRNVLDYLGEGIKGYKKSDTVPKKQAFLAKHFADSKEFTENVRKMLDTFDDIVDDELEFDGIRAKTPDQLSLMRSQIQDLLEEAASNNEIRIKKAELRRRLKLNDYQKLRTEAQNAFAEWKKAGQKGINKAKINDARSRFNNLKNKVRKLNKSIRTAVDAEWANGSIQKKFVDNQAKRLDVFTRPNFAHTRPLVKAISMIQGHLLANSRWWRDPVTGFHIDTSITRQELISILETAEEGYGFIANLDDIAIGAKLGQDYDGDKVLQALIKRLQLSDEILGDVLRQGFEKNMEIHFGKKLPYAKDVYGSGGDLRNLMTSLEGQIEGKREYARKKGANNEYSGNRNESNIDETEWNTSFNDELLSRLKYILKEDSTRSKKLMEAMEGLSGGERIKRALDLINEFIPKGQDKLRSFSQLGGGTEAVDWVGPKRAAQAVLSALTSDRPYANKVAESYVVKGEKGPERARRLSSIAEDGIYIQHDSDPVIQRNFERATADHAMNWLLSKLDDPKLTSEGRKDIYNKLEQWLDEFPEQRELNKAVKAAVPRQGLSFIPRWMVTGPDADIISSKFAGLRGQIEYNQMMSRTVTPALMATIHDAIFVGLPTMMTKYEGAAASPNWNYTDARGKHVLRGIGFGFQTMIAREGTFEDALNVAHQLIYNYDGLVDNARNAYNKMSRKRIEKLRGKRFESNDEFIGYMVKDFADSDDDVKVEAIKEMFPGLASAYMDADSSGSNIMLALVMGQEADFGSLWKQIKESAGKDDEPIFEAAHSEARNNAYKHVENYVFERLKDKNFKGKKGLEDVYTNIGKVFKYLQGNEGTKAILKGPVMTDSYGIGAKAMAADIREKFSDANIKEGIIKSGLFKESEYDSAIHALSDTLATLLSKGLDDNLGGWIKTSLFGTKMTNADLGDIIKKWKGINSSDKIRTAGEEKSMAESNAIVDANDGTAEANAAFRAGTREEILDFESMFTEVKDRVQTLAEVTGDPEKAKEWVNKFVGLIETDLKSNKNLKKLLDEGRYAEAQDAIDVAFNKLASENIMVKSLNSYMAQGYGFDEAKFVNQLKSIFTNDQADTINTLLGRLNPITRMAMKGQMFRQLGISPETRNFIATDFDQIADKLLRLAAEESPLGVGRLVLESLSDEDIRERTILQAIKEISEIYDLEKLGLKIGNEKFKNLTWEQYFKQWEQDSEIGQQLRERAIDALKTIRWNSMLDEIDKQLAENPQDQKVQALERRKEAIEQLMKMFTRIIDSTNEARPTDAAKRMELVSGSENVINVGRMPGLLGALPQTTTRRFEGAPIPILRMAQLEQTADVRRLRSLKEGASIQDANKPVFTQKELSRQLTPEDFIDVKKYKGSMYDVPLSSKPVYSLQDAPSPAIAAELLKAELTNFANQVGGKTKEYLNKGNYFMVYNTQRNLIAEQETMKAEGIYRDIAQQLHEKRQEILQNKEATDDLTESELLNKNEDYVNLKLELAKAQDNALMVRNEVLAIDGSWAVDVDEKVWSVMSMNGESLETISSGRTYGEAVNKTAMENPRSGNMIAWLAPPAKSPGEVISDFGTAGGLRYEEGANVAMLPKTAHSIDASGPLYMGNHIQVTGWVKALEGILGREASSNEVTVFVRWADAVARWDVDAQIKLKKEFPDFIEPYKTKSSFELHKLMGEGQREASNGFRDANAAIVYMNKPVIREQVIENLKAQFGDDFEAEFKKRSGGVTLEEAMNFKPKKLTDENTIIFVNPLGVVIAPHKVVGQGIVNLTMQERVLGLNGIQNQRVVDRMRLATMLNRKLPANSEISSRMGGYDPFTKFSGMTIDRARRNAAILTDALEELHSRHTTQKLSVAVDKRHTIRHGTLTESPMRFLKFTDAINEQGAKEARMILAENTLEALPLSSRTLEEINNARKNFNKFDEFDWANAIQIGLMTGRDSAWVVFKERLIAEERLNNRRDLDPEDFENELYSRWEKIKPIIDIIRRELNTLNKDEGFVRRFLSERNDVFFGAEASSYTNHNSMVSLYSQKLNIEKAVEIEIMNMTLVPDNKSFDRSVQFVKPINDLNGVVPRSDGTQMKPNTIDARMRDYPTTDGHLMLTHRLDTFVSGGVINRDQANVLKLAFWDYDTDSLNKIFDPMKQDDPLRFDIVDSANYLGRYEQVNKAFTDGVVHRINYLRGLSSRFEDDASLGPAAIVLEEIGHALGHRLSSDDQINFIQRVKDIEIEAIEEAQKVIFKDKAKGERYEKRLQQLRDDKARMEEDIPEAAARRTELFGAMFAISALHKAKNQWDTITKGADVQEALTDAHAIIDNLDKLAIVSGIEDIHGKSLFGDVGETLKSSINLDVKVNKRNKPTDDERSAGEEDSPLYVDLDSSKQNEDIRRTQSDTELEELIEQIRDPDTGVVDLTLLGNPNRVSITERDRVALRILEDKSKRSVSGGRIETPLSDFVAKIAFGKLTNNEIARISDLFSSPFGMRQFAFATDGKVPLSAPILHLFNAADSQSYFTSGAFEDAMPTIQGLGLYLRGEFEKIIPALALLKGQNMTKGPLGPEGGETTPWSLYSSLWREMVMEYTSKDQAKKVLREKLESMQGDQRAFKKFLGNKKQADEFIDIIAETADSWANPKTGLWRHIVDSMITAGMVRPEKRDDLISKAAYPIKFKASVFDNATDIDGDTPRRELRRAVVDIVKQRMEGSNAIDVDVLQIALADQIPTPSGRRGEDPETYKNNLPLEIQALLNSPEIKNNFEILLNKIRKGDITMKDLGEVVRKQYTETLLSDDLIGSDNPNKKAMLLELSEEFRNKLAKSQQTSTLDLQATTAAEFVAHRYINNIGSSSYSFAGDAFLSSRQLWNDPRISKFLEDDPIALLDSVKRGTAAQAFDRATYSNYFGIKGFGIKDLIEIYKKIGNGENTHHEFKTMFMTKDMELDDRKRSLTNDERTKFKAGIDHIDNMYKYSVGTLSSLDNKYAAPFLNILNIISELGTALSIAPRLAVATAIEETPMSIGSVLKDNLLGAKKELQEVLALTKKTKDIEETLKGLGHITSSVMHQSAALAAKLGDDGTGSYGVTDKKKIKQIYRFLSMGMNKQVMAARSLGAMQYVHRIDRLFSNIAGDISIEGIEGRQIGIMRQGEGGFHVTADELFLQLQNKYNNDFSTLNRTNFTEFSKQLGLDEELSRDVMEMIKVGLFEVDKYRFFRNMWVKNRNQILRTGVPFDDIRNDITFNFENNLKEGIDAEGIRARKLQAVNALRELVFVASTKFAKQPSLSTQPLGARNTGVLSTFFTRLTTYASSTGNTLRRAMFAGPSSIAAAFTAHMITGWLYYKLVQLQGFRTIEEMKKELEKDPIGELSDAVMSVPFLGANQMVINMLIQMMRGERPVNSKAYDIAALSAANSLLQLPVRVMKAIDDIISGDWEKGTANLAQRLPVPHAWALAIALRNAGMFERDVQISRLSPKYFGQAAPRPIVRRQPSDRALPNNEVLEQQFAPPKPQVIPEHTNDTTLDTTPSSIEEDRVSKLLNELNRIGRPR